MVNDLVGKLVADKYLIESLLFESEDGDIYRGRHETLGKAVTIKVLSPALSIDQRWVKRFVDEARAASAISHPNILSITDFGTDARGITYAIFEELTGEPLKQLLSGGLMLEEARALSIGRQISSAVGAAHQKGLVHGSLDPQKIFVSVQSGDTVKVTGFGRDPLMVSRTADPRYLAPEQCTGFPVAEIRSDIYSLGVLLYEMLSGGVPYEGKTVAEVLDKQNSEPPAPLSAFRRDLRLDVEPMVLTAMSADPGRRYQTMSAFEEDLERLTGPSEPVSVVAVSSKHNVWQTAFIVLAGVVVLGSLLIYATSTKKTDPTIAMQAEAGSLPVQPIGPATGAQEESLAKLPAQTDAEIMAAANQQQNGGLPGGDGYNAWANGGVPPPGAPLNQNNTPAFVQPGGQTISVQGGSQFMPADVLPPGCTMLPSGVVLCPKPLDASNSAGLRPLATPRNTNANTASPQTAPAATPKPLPAQTPPGGSRVPAGQSTPRPAPPPAGTTTKPPATGGSNEGPRASQ